MTRIYFVRHAEIRRDKDLLPDNWELAENAEISIRKMFEGISIDKIDQIYYSPLQCVPNGKYNKPNLRTSKGEKGRPERG